MKKVKVMAFTDEQKQRARLLKALSHPARLAILEYLAEIKTCITGDIADELPLGRTTVNQHLKELKDAGLVKGTVEGVRTNYCLNVESVRQLEQELNAFFKKIHSDGPFC